VVEVRSFRLDRIDDQVKTILRDALTGLYYGDDHTWSADPSKAKNFDSIQTAAAVAQSEKLETVDVILKYDNPACELTLPLSVCFSDAANAAFNRWYPSPRQSGS
jgi:hypothetical protein